MNNWASVVEVSDLDGLTILQLPRLAVFLEPVSWTNFFKMKASETVVTSGKRDQKS